MAHSRMDSRVMSQPAAVSQKVNAVSQKFEIGKILGTGAFSEVRLAKERATGKEYAIKVIDKAKCKGKENMIETEVSILKRVQHSHIIQLYEMFEIENKIYLVMELVTGGELFDDIVGRGKYTEVDAARIIQKILLAIDYLHAMGIAHRDLKPENLLLSDKSRNAKIMISDFGLSKIFNEDEIMKTACGTPGYVAPEVLKRQGYSKEVDLWAIGVITYILLCGYPPFYDQNNVELFKQIMEAKYEFDRPWWDNISEQAKDFIRHLLVLDTRKRYTAKQALHHPFIVTACGLPDFVKNGSHVNRIPNGVPPRRQSVTVSLQPIIQPPQNLAPTVKQNLQRVMSSKGSLKHMEVRADGQGDRVAAIDDEDMTGPVSEVPQARPLGKGDGVDDSGIVTSRNAVNQSQPIPIPVPRPHTAPQQYAPSSRRHARRGAEPVNGYAPQDCLPCGNGAHAGSKPLSSNPASPMSPGLAQNSVASLFKAKSFQGSMTYITPYVNGAALPPMPSNGPKSIRLLSYNIFMRPPGIKNNTSDYKNARLMYIGERMLGQYDVVAFQEMFSYGSSRQAKMLSYAKKHGLEYCICSPSKGLLNATIDGGLMICSRYPIIEGAKLTYKRGVHSDRFSAKGALYAKIAVSPNQFIHVFTTHLQASYGWPVNLNDPAVVNRIGQLCLLKEFIDECTRNKHPNEPILLMGDMNVNARVTPEEGRAHSEEYQIMIKILKGILTPAQLFGHPQTDLPQQIRMDVRDILYERHGQHPITFADVTDFKTKTPRETVLTCSDELGCCASLDYIFYLNHEDAMEISSGGDARKFEVSQKETRVEEFMVDNEPFSQLSDHYGVTTTLNVS